jgi:elongation factor 1-beta
VTLYKAVQSSPDIGRFPNISRWARHIETYMADASDLPGDPAKAHTSYGPEFITLTINPAKPAAGAGEDNDIDLIGRDEEEEDAGAARLREERLAEYNNKKAAKSKPAAKSVVSQVPSRKR